MDIDEAVDKFLENLANEKKEMTICPICKTKLKITYAGASYTVSCETENCLQETF